MTKTTPIKWMEFISGVLPVMQKANYMLCNALQRPLWLSSLHILNCLAVTLDVQQHTVGCHHQHPKRDIIQLITDAVKMLPPLLLQDPVTHVGSHLLDCTT